jgi:hypothetical protein
MCSNSAVRPATVFALFFGQVVSLADNTSIKVPEASQLMAKMGTVITQVPIRIFMISDARVFFQV